MSILRNSGISFFLSVAVGAAAAQAEDGVADRYKGYVGLGGGVNFIQDDDPTLAIGGGNVNPDVEYETGWAAGGTLGMFLDNAWRVELESTYRDNDSESITLPGGGATGVSAEIDGWAVMLNAIKDIPTSSKITPYIGVGVGYATRDIDVNCGPGCGTNADDNGFAYQGILGLTADVAERVQFFTDYRYFTPHDFEYSSGSQAAALNDLDDNNHTIMAGLRIGFGPKVVAPPVVPMEAPNEYIVYFGFDQDSLTAEADAVLNQVVADVANGNMVRMDLAGHTDTSGSDGYNMGLSERRVDTVRARLVALGIDESKISVMSFGESQPAVATGDGVREPQNRRVTIVVNN